MKNDALSICPGQEISYVEALEIEVGTLRARLSQEERNREQYEQKEKEWSEQRNAMLATIACFFASRSEKQKYMNDSAQQMQFDFADFDFGSFNFATAEEPEEERPALAAESPAPPRTRRKSTKKTLSKVLDALPVEETILQEVAPPDCQICGEQMHVIGYSTWKELCVRPAQLYAREYKSPVFACGNCEKNGTMVPIVRPEMPLVRPLPRSVVSAETLAWVVYQKVAMFTPFYRLEAFFFQMDVDISRMTLCNWMIGVGEAWLEPLTDRMHAELLSQPIIHADETPFQVLDEPGRKAQSKGYCWLFCSTYNGTEARYTVFIYSASRAHEVPQEFLQGFQGYLMTDGHKAYDTMAEKTKGIFLCRCWAHCRREWYKAVQKVHPEPNSPLAIGYAYIEKFFELERAFGECAPEERFFLRLKHEKPLLDEFHTWLEKQYQGKNAFSKAVKYTLNYWDDLYQVLADGRLPATNAAAELMAKSVALTRKNSLFAKTLGGVDALMAGFTVVETAKANGLKPYEYLLWIFSQMPKDWNFILESGLNKALEQADDLAKKTFAELALLLKPSLKTPGTPEQPLTEWEAAARAILWKEVVEPVRNEIEAKLISEAKFVLSGYYLPQHAPPACRKSKPQFRENDVGPTSETA